NLLFVFVFISNPFVFKKITAFHYPNAQGSQINANLFKFPKMSLKGISVAQTLCKFIATRQPNRDILASSRKRRTSSVPTDLQRGRISENPPDEHTKTPCQLKPEQLLKVASSLW
ncbi:MAG TPA: hypothetical protein PLW19_07670, partial [Anaerolineaceae bacterium]|nr:hypothetical protein [Anaerolineaceae bacterium]